MRNAKDKFGKVAVIIHWVMAVMVIGLVFIGFSFDDFEKPLKFTIIGLHKATGTLVLILALFRWYWMISNDSPAPADGTSKAETGISHATKWTLMLAIVGMPMSGIIMSMFAGFGIDMFGVFTISPMLEKNIDNAKFFGSLHNMGAYAISIIIGLHILAALKHHFINKNNILSRMLGR